MTSLVGTALRPARNALTLARETVESAALAGLDSALESRFAREAVDRILDSPGFDRLVQSALQSPGLERVVTHTIESRLLDTVVERLLETDELWLLVEEIAESPAVTGAISRQSTSFANLIAGEVRVRSGRADTGLERVARRVLRRSDPP